MGALPSQKYEHVLLAFAEWYNNEQISFENGITEKMIRDFLRKCDNLEIDVR